jgi:hypothetical protein
MKPNEVSRAKKRKNRALLPYRAHVTVNVHTVAGDQPSLITMQMPFSVEAVDAAIGAALASMAVATEGNAPAITDAKRYLQKLPQVFDELRRRKAAALMVRGG